MDSFVVLQMACPSQSALQGHKSTIWNLPFCCCGPRNNTLHPHLPLVRQMDSHAPNSRHWLNHCCWLRLVQVWCSNKQSNVLKAPHSALFGDISLQMAYLLQKLHYITKTPCNGFDKGNIMITEISLIHCPEVCFPNKQHNLLLSYYSTMHHWKKWML